MIKGTVNRTIFVKKGVQSVTIGYDGPYEAHEALRGDSWITLYADVNLPNRDSEPEERNISIVPEAFDLGGMKGYEKLTTVTMLDGRVFYIYGEIKKEADMKSDTLLLKVPFRLNHEYLGPSSAVLSVVQEDDEIVLLFEPSDDNAKVPFIFLGLGHSVPEGFYSSAQVMTSNGVFAYMFRKQVEYKNVVLRSRLKIVSGRQTLLVGDQPILHVAEDRQGLGRIDIWYQGADGVMGKQGEDRDFLVVGTGEAFPDGFHHIGTVVASNNFVWHIYREDL